MSEISITTITLKEMSNNIVLFAVRTEYVTVTIIFYVGAKDQIRTEINHSEWSNNRKELFPATVRKFGIIESFDNFLWLFSCYLLRQGENIYKSLTHISSFYQYKYFFDSRSLY